MGGPRTLLHLHHHHGRREPTRLGIHGLGPSHPEFLAHPQIQPLRRMCMSQAWVNWVQAGLRTAEGRSSWAKGSRE